MTGAKEVRTKIKSIKSTQKITRAMEMVAASKMRKAQERMMATRPYNMEIQRVASHLASVDLEIQHVYLETREIKRVGLIVVSTDRGLCGGLNTNLFRLCLERLVVWDKNKIGVDVCTMGSKAHGYFKRMGSNVIAQAQRLGDTPSAQEVIGPITAMLSAYQAKEIDVLYMAYNTFVNTMTQKPALKQLLPIEADEGALASGHWDYLYEPEAQFLIDTVLSRYIESQAYQGVVENFACEQAARMVAMRSASDNAGDLIDSLQLVYNKARQAAITQELSEIVSGASAV